MVSAAALMKWVRARRLWSGKGGAWVLLVEDVGVCNREFYHFIAFYFSIFNFSELNKDVYWCITIFPCAIWFEFPSNCF